MAHWRAQLLGTFALYRDDQLVDVPSSISKSVLAYLLLADAPVSRDVIISALWPEHPEAEARNTLSQAIWKFKRAVGADTAAELLDVRHGWLSLQAPAEIDIDVKEFTSAISEARGSLTPEAESRSLERAVDLYAGDLLLGLFDDWIRPRQLRLKHELDQALERLYDLQASSGEFVAALAAVRRLAELVPGRELTHRRVMKMLHLLGRREEALAYYHEWASMYRRDLGAEPSRESRSLFRAITSSRPRDIPPDPGEGFVGRAAELKAALTAVEGSANRVGAVVLVAGEVGVGRSAFLQKLDSELYWRGQGTVRLSCTGDGSTSFGTIAALITSMLDECSATALDEIVPEVLVAEASRLVPEVRRFIRPPSRTWPEFPDPHRTREALLQVLEALVMARPVVIMLDDIHQADPDTLEMIDEVAERLVVAGAGVVLTYPIVSEETTALSRRLAGLSELVATELVVLPRFNEVEIDQFVRSRGDLVPHPDRLRQLYAETGGHPLYLTLLMRHQRNVAGTGRVSIPKSLTGAVADRLAALTDAERDVLEALALVPGGLRLDALAHVMGVAVDEQVDSLVLSRHVDRNDDRLRVSLDIVRVAVMKNSDPPRVRRRHAALAEWVAAAGDLTRFAEHAYLAELWTEAALSHVALASRAQEVNAPGFAALHYERAVEAGRAGGLSRDALFAAIGEYADFLAAFSRQPESSDLPELLDELASTDRERLVALARRAELLRVQGRYQPALVACERGLQLAAAPEDVVRFGLMRAVIRRLQGDSVRGVDELAEIETASSIPDELRARLAHARALLLLRLGRVAEMDAALDEALQQSEDDPILHTDILNTRALRALEAGRLEESVEQQAQIYELAAELGYRYRMANSRWNTAIAYLNLDQIADSIDAAEDAVALSKEAGSPYLEAMASLSLASALYEAVGGAPIEELIRTARAFARRREVVSADTWGAELEALVAHDRAQHREAGRLIAYAIRVNTERDLPWGALNALMSQARMKLESGRPDEALPDLDQAHRLSDQLVSSIHPQPISAMRALAHAGMGHTDQAVAAAEAVMRSPMTWYSQHRSYLYVSKAWWVLGDRDRALEAIELSYQHFQRLLGSLSPALADQARRTASAQDVIESWMLARTRNESVILENEAGRRVNLDWTISKPEDREVKGALARRRHRVARMVKQAAAAGVATPPVLELSEALGVSPSTIRRDLDALRSRSAAL